MEPSGLSRSFRKKYELLSGKVHEASSVEKAAQMVASIALGAAAKRVALATLPKDLEASIRATLSERGVEVVGPNFSASELPHLIDDAQIGVSNPDFAIVETGTLVELATDDAFRLVSTLPRTHIGIVRVKDLVETLDASAPLIRTFFNRNPENAVVSFISGPSRTADIEMRLTLGVHGPEVAHAILLDTD